MEESKSLNLISHRIFTLFINILFSLLAIIILMPILIVVALLIKIEDGGPILYTQYRVGKDNKIFKIYKIRSMKLNSGDSNPRWAKKNDDRITKVGRIIRKTRIDETPQIFNILKGDMNLIGPRPEVPELTVKFNKEIKGFINRLQVKPGLTGWAQVHGGYDLSPKEKYQNDMYYIKNRSIYMDILIIIKTIKVIMTGDGAR